MARDIPVTDPRYAPTAARSVSPSPAVASNSSAARATVLSALVGVVVNQYDASLLTTVAAVLSAALVALALLRGHRWRRGRTRACGSRDGRNGRAGADPSGGRCGPDGRGERVLVIDVLRGFALLGILVVNVAAFRAPVFGEADGGVLDRVATFLSPRMPPDPGSGTQRPEGYNSRPF